MNKLILFLLLLISTIQISFAQNVVEIGMSREKILLLNNDTCFSDTLDNGTKFIKAMLIDKQNFIYYFFRDDDTCFCVIVYFENYTSVKKFKDVLNLHYKKKNHNLWISSDEKYFIYYDEDSLNIDVPIFYLWSDRIKRPNNWKFLDEMKN